MTLDASISLTGVEPVQTAPFQWLNTTVRVLGCQVTRRQRPSPRLSPSATLRLRPSSTRRSMHLQRDGRYGDLGHMAR